MRALLLAALLAGAAQAQTWEPFSPALQTRAAGGDADAQYQLGEAYRTGNGVAQNADQAVIWFRKAADRDLRAADALAIALFVKGERKQAIPALQAAAARNNDYALYILGTARFNGDYVPKDLGRAYADMRAAAKTLPQAQRSLALMEQFVTAADRERAETLSAQAGGPESGAPAAPTYAANAPPPKTALTKKALPKAAVVAPVATVPTPAASAQMPAPPPPNETGPLPSAIRAVDLPPSQPAPTVATTPVPAPTPAPTVKPKPAAKVPPAADSAPTGAPAGPGAYRVQLGAYGSVALAEGQWKALTGKVPQIAKLQKTTQPVGALTRLQATGIQTRDEANTLCQAVTAAHFPCLVIKQ